MDRIEAAWRVPPEVAKKLDSREWETVGLLVRDSRRKTFRYIIKGCENIQTNSAGLPVHPQLDALQSAIGAQQILGMAAIAQNAALAVSLERIEARLDAINDRLTNLESQLRQIGADVVMTRAAIFHGPIAKIHAAKNAASHAIRRSDLPNLIAATKDIEEAGRLLLNHASILVREQSNKIPDFMRGKTAELGELVTSAVHAFLVASDLHVHMDAPDIALRMMRDINTRIQMLMGEIKAALSGEESLVERAASQLDNDETIMELGRIMTRAFHDTLGRAIFIGLLTDDTTQSPAVDGEISFIPVPQSLADWSDPITRREKKKS